MSETTTTKTTASTPAWTPTAYDWREDMKKAGSEKDKSAKYNKQAGARLWKACKAGISEWLPNSSDDANGETLYGEFIEAYGTTRKGDCSKMKTVAMTVKSHGLVLDEYENLSKAYAAAIKMTKTAKAETAEDDAADEAIRDIASSVSDTPDTPEGAARLVLAKGVDEAARLLLDALGVDNTPAHRALLRAVNHEMTGRTKPAPKKEVTDAPKDGAEQASTAKATTAKAKAAPAKAKPKAAPVAPAKQAKPVAVSASKGDPNKKALPPKAAPAKAAPVKAAPVKAAPVKRAAPVAKRG